MPEPNTTPSDDGVGSFSGPSTGQIFALHLLNEHGMNTHGIYWASCDGTAWGQPSTSCRVTTGDPRHCRLGPRPPAISVPDPPD
ncbi:MAG: hypothetical protein IPL39_11295 [Opitutaceae bacterium]|nr:hypothetical protein [Opitutaceae bacterium]